MKKAWARQQTGFTIVELLIVIVVIAILAAITIVAFNGVQTRARNTETLNAVAAYAKAIKLYHADKGDWPFSSCLGDTDTYQGLEGVCWPPVTSGGAWHVRDVFTSAILPYLGGNLPEPDTTNIGTDTDPYRGAMFYRAASDIRIYFHLAGVTECPDVAGLRYIGKATHEHGISCYTVLSTDI